MMQLYYSPGSVALASMIALAEAGAEYQAVRLDFRSAEQTKAPYLAINPKGRAPALVTDEGVITETPAILTYVAERFPQARLAPVGDPFAHARLQSFNAYLCSTVHPAHAHRLRGYRWADEESSFADMRRKAPSVVAACFDLIERELLVGPWVMGEAYTTADPYLFTLTSWLPEDEIDLARHPRVHAHRQRVAERPATRAALAVEAS